MPEDTSLIPDDELRPPRFDPVHRALSAWRVPPADPGLTDRTIDYVRSRTPAPAAADLTERTLRFVLSTSAAAYRRARRAAAIFLLVAVPCAAHEGLEVWEAHQRSAHELQCQEHIQLLADAMLRYQRDHGRFPPSQPRLMAQELVRQGYVRDYGIFVCPADPDNDGQDVSYVLAAAADADPRGAHKRPFPLLADRPGNHSTEHINVLILGADLIRAELSDEGHRLLVQRPIRRQAR